MLKSREVLCDCRLALQMLEEETDLQKWRILWASALSLVRTVGHVLDKVDRRDENTEVISKLYKEWISQSEKHLIFRKFIELERNNLLKEYRLSYNSQNEIWIVAQGKPISGKTQSTSLSESVFDVGQDNIYRPLIEGPWEGIDARDVLKEAIDWWEVQLSIIEKS